METQEAPRKMKQYLKLSTFDQVNEYAELGYKLHTVINGNVDGVPYVEYFMYLDKGAYEDVKHLADVTPQDVDTYLANGWEITSTSISTKFVRMIKRSL